MLTLKQVTKWKWEDCPICGGRMVAMPEEERREWVRLTNQDCGFVYMSSEEKLILGALRRKMAAGRHIGNNPDC